MIDVSAQRLDLLSRHGNTLLSWPVSTSRYGIGTREGSFMTPPGRFIIGEKIGNGEPPWTIFKGRVSTGHTAQPGGSEDLILSRILWLEGMDAENKNSRERYIYIHGTNQEELIGTPVSHGCIRLRNDHIVDLYDRVEVGTAVIIKLGESIS